MTTYPSVPEWASLIVTGAVNRFDGCTITTPAPNHVRITLGRYINDDGDQRGIVGDPWPFPTGYVDVRREGTDNHGAVDVEVRDLTDRCLLTINADAVVSRRLVGDLIEQVVMKARYGVLERPGPDGENLIEQVERNAPDRDLRWATLDMLGHSNLLHRLGMHRNRRIRSAITRHTLAAMDLADAVRNQPSKAGPAWTTKRARR